MGSIEHLGNYLVLLKIRQKAYHRNLVIAGGLFFMAILLTTATLLFTEWNARSIWLMGIFNVLFTTGFLMAWARLEILTGTIELMNNLQNQDR